MAQEHHQVSRRQFVQATVAAATAVQVPWQTILAADAAKPIAIGSQRELFVDDYLIDRLSGEAELRLHHPTPKGIVLKHDATWEGSGTGYHSIFQDGARYRMYYSAWHLEVANGKVTNPNGGCCCYAESDDGISWRKPDLELIEFQGSKKNNIVLWPGKLGDRLTDPAHVAVFLDERPGTPADARFKAVVGTTGRPHGLFILQSADGLHWQPLSDKPVIYDDQLDSQNLAFWDSARNTYRAYWRFYTDGNKPGSLRSIRTAESPNLLDWSTPHDLTYVDSPPQQLYTNQIKPYYLRAQVLIGFPTRYMNRGWTDSTDVLPELEERSERAKQQKRYGTAITEGLFMTSRNGQLFKRWNEAFLRPGIERPGTWNYGHQYIGWQVVETKSEYAGAPNELSLYATESYWTGDSSELRRWTMRLDGFVSAAAPFSGGELITKPFTFTGKRLSLNFATSAAGGVGVELQTADGKPLEGFTATPETELYGDSVDRTVTWNGKSDVSSLQGRAIRIRFTLKDADLYALQFTD